MTNYIPNSKKSEHVKKIINEALVVLNIVGIPFEGKRERGLESMAMCFLAVAGIIKSWKEAKGQKENRHITTRNIIEFINEYFEEKISSGSYDDVRRKHLKLLIVSDLVLNSANNPSAATNDPTRGYTLRSDFKELIKNFDTKQWEIKLKLFLQNQEPLSAILERKRNIPKVSIQLPENIKIDLSQGGHNDLQKEIIEEFLPRFGNGCEVLYIGDTKNKLLHYNEQKLKSLGFFKLSNDELPDIVAYNKNKNWLYLIEAVYSSGPMSEIRMLELKKALSKCTAELIFITAFISKNDFKKYFSEIGWESEVWTADNPDHMVHFNGNKFLGPHKK